MLYGLDKLNEQEEAFGDLERKYMTTFTPLKTMFSRMVRKNKSFCNNLCGIQETILRSIVADSNSNLFTL